MVGKVEKQLTQTLSDSPGAIDKILKAKELDWRFSFLNFSAMENIDNIIKLIIK